MLQLKFMNLIAQKRFVKDLKTCLKLNRNLNLVKTIYVLLLMKRSCIVLIVLPTPITFLAKGMKRWKIRIRSIPPIV